jgi:hypothetical protein
MAQRCSCPDIDPVTGDILKSDNRLFSVLDRAGKPLKSLNIDNAIQRASARGSNAARILIESGIMAHPQGRRCLVWGDPWAVWLEWDDDKAANPADDKVPQPEAP